MPLVSCDKAESLDEEVSIETKSRTKQGETINAHVSVSKSLESSAIDPKVTQKYGACPWIKKLR
jgi:hypothetical protein